MSLDKASIALDLLPQTWRCEFKPEDAAQAEEIRLRLGQAPTVLERGKERSFRKDAVKEQDLVKVLEKATGASLHASLFSLSEGYVNHRGVRIGVCGFVRPGREGLGAYSSFTSLAIRIPRERRGICREAAELLLERPFPNTLLVGPPGAGKTTALRELIRSLSERRLRIAVADERNELAAMDAQGTGFDLGPCTDVLSGIPKAEAAMMLLRAMNPQVIAMDELTREQDLSALDQIAGCGVGILASVHGAELRELRQRRAYRVLLESGLFRWILRIEQSGADRSYRLESVGA